MNVLILTPDAVGSTLLQRLITVYMQFHDFDRPVINLHELTTGLNKYFSPEFNREIISKRTVVSRGYYQNLDEVTAILQSVDHFKVTRLAQYHINNRQDPLDQQLPFYRYLDDNFFVIACLRQNVFEHALSLVLSMIVKRRNVYSHGEKFDVFSAMYNDPIKVDCRVLLNKLEQYKSYLEWSKNNFEISSYFSYETDLINIEKYILELPVFTGAKKRVTWQQKFGIEFAHWNRLHNLVPQVRFLDTNKSKLATTKNDVATDLVTTQSYQKSFDHVNDTLERMKELDIIPTPLPIKKQTLKEKIKIIRNFQECLDHYNHWIMNNPEIGSPLTTQDFELQQQSELSYYQSSSAATGLFAVPAIGL